MLFFALFAWLCVAQAQDLVPPGTTLEDAAAVQLSEEGLANLGANLGVLIPSPVPVDDITQSGGVTCANFDLLITNMLVDVEVSGASLVPLASNSDARADLQLQIDLLVAINDATNKFGLDYAFDFCLTSPDGSCPGYIEPFPVTVRGPVSILVVDDGSGTGETTLDVQIGDLEVVNGLQGEDIKLDCGIGTLESLLNRVGLSFFDLIINALDPVLQGLIQDQVGDLEAQLSEALAAASVDQVIDLQGIALRLRLYPGSATSTPAGLQLGLDGFTEGTPDSTCVPLVPSGSAFTDSEALPDLAQLGTTDAALQLSDDFANQALFEIWKGGLLCLELGEGAESSLDIGLPLNSSLLGLIGGDEFSALFPEDGPLLIRTNPVKPPEVNYDGANDVVLEIRDLGLDMYAELDFRMARPLGMTIEADAGIDVLFDNSTGVAAIDLALGPDEVRPEATMVEVAPSAKETVEQNFQGLLDSLLDTLLGSALEGLSFGLPSLDGFGITELDLGGSAGGEWLTGAAELGVVSYPSGGCDEGCSGGTDSGCSTGGAAPWLLMVVVPLLRRRSDS